MPTTLIALGAVTLLAATVNGALGYGFSSITVPLALLFLPGRSLNPALVAIEVPLNAYALIVNRHAVSRVLTRALPLLVALVPGIVAGTWLVARIDADVLKLATFSLLLPIALLQAAGKRRPIRAERAAGPLAGALVGALYAVTTVSGPPLAAMLNNQGLAAQEFRAAMALIRLAESSVAAVAYAAAGLFHPETLALSAAMAPSLVIGVPVGAWLVRRVDAETFRRITMSFDAWIIAFGLTSLLRARHMLDPAATWALLTLVTVIDAGLLSLFFRKRLTEMRSPRTISPADSR